VKRHIALIVLLVAGCKKAAPEEKVAPPDKGSGSAVTETGSGSGSGGVAPSSPADDALIAEAKKFVADMQEPLRNVMVAASEAEWTQETDITPEHEAAASKAAADNAKLITKLIKDSKKFEPILAKLDPDTRRQLLLLKYSGQPAPDDPAKADELAKLASEMSSIYGKGKACENGAPTGKKCLDVDGLSKILQTSRKPAELLAAWKSWHDNVGHAVKEDFTKYVSLANEGARNIGFKDVSELWQGIYDMPASDFPAVADKLYDQLKPLYTQLHCYTRTKLNKLYGDKLVSLKGPIPAHLLGNMWAQSWEYLYKELEPYPGQPSIDVTKTLEKSYDPKKMVQMGEAFYTSLGFPALPATFWERSMLTKPPGKEVVCHASSWDVAFNDDLRIKMCINKNQEDLLTIHHELGHSMYFAAYYKLPILFQGGANDGFHEAIGDTVQLSMTPEYLKEKGLLDKVEKNDKMVLNQQMMKALEKIAFLPWGLMVDKWRWDVFSGAVKPEDYNKHWWELRLKYQGVSPPLERGPADFDPGAKYHVAANVPYMRYFLAAVLQFQFHRALCKKAGFTGPLNECSIYNNKEAGKAYWEMLQKGASQPWQDTLFQLTGSREMDATAILEYFAPLQKWLEEQNKGQSCGWE
jgi:peptidyl-dipeptidase A